MAHETELLNYVGGAWQRSHARDHLHVTNPATGVALADVPLSPAQEVDAAVRAAASAWPAWRRVPPLERIQYLFKLKQRLEDALPMLRARSPGRQRRSRRPRRDSPWHRERRWPPASRP
jgi:malonate-semialdehyde dehydrogenase (acetylating)/methylmalonate-semialdehyde dehydrogenase